jgi:hypothetical protein
VDKSLISIFYRLSDLSVSTKRPKLSSCTKQNCLQNAVTVFSGCNFTVVLDSDSEDLLELVHSLRCNFIRSDARSGGGTFRLAAKHAMDLPDDEIVYLIEDDFLHRKEARDVLLDGIQQNVEYVTLYDHPDKYINAKSGGNPYVKHGGERTRLLLGKHSHWKFTGSTVMTFATRSGQLRKDWSVFLRHCPDRYTDDFRLFRELSWRGRRLIGAVPGYATHCETAHLSPLYDWASMTEFGDV